jgi:hypothetical protein
MAWGRFLGDAAAGRGGSAPCGSGLSVVEAACLSLLTVCLSEGGDGMGWERGRGGASSDLDTAGTMAPQEYSIA